MTLLFLAAFALQDPPRITLKGSPQEFEIALPAGYAFIKGGVLPEAVARSYAYRLEWQGVEEWEKIRLYVDANRERFDLPPAADPDALFGLTYGPERREDRPRTIVASPETQEKIGPHRARLTEVRFAQDMNFFAAAAQIETSPKPILILIGGPVTFEERIRGDLRSILKEIRIPTDCLPKEDVERLLRVGAWTGGPAIALMALYAVCWAVFFRGAPDHDHVLRLAWHAAAGVLWIVDIIMGFQAWASARMLEMPLPLLVRPELSCAGAAVCLALAVARLFRHRGAFKWA